MNKKTFLDKLRKRLQILNNDEIEDIIEEYEGHINEKVSSGIPRAAHARMVQRHNPASAVHPFDGPNQRFGVSLIIKTERATRYQTV